MSQIQNLWLHLACVFICIALCAGLECYDCASKDDQVCMDNFDDARKESVGTGECGNKATHCVKYKTIAFLQDSGFITGKAREIRVVTRTCINMKGYSDGCIAVESDSGFYIRCLCSTDGCNGGKSVLPSLTVIALTILSAIYFNLKR